MESKTKFMGHPIHPILITIPYGLFASAIVFDIIYLITSNTTFTVISFYNIALGIIGGLLAALFGFVDWLSIPEDTRARSVGTVHGLGNATVVLLFAISFFLRGSDSAYLPSTLALVFSFAGILLALVTGWLGGELVYRLSVGQSEGANLDAPSSLSRAPANAHLAPIPVTGSDTEKEVTRQLDEGDIDMPREAHEHEEEQRSAQERRDIDRPDGGL
jgi:uncharacterized membrane protein